MKPLLVVFFTVMLDLVGFGIVIPNLPYYAQAFGASELQVTLIMAGYSLAQFLCVPMLGQVSDRIGRRPVLLASIGMTALMLFTLANARALWMVVVFRILHGAMTANLGTAQACIADLTTPENRAKGMGLFGAAFGIGFTIGPFLGGELSHVPDWLAARGLLDPFLPLLGGDAVRARMALPLAFAGLLSALNFVLALAWLPETRHAGSTTSERSISPRALWHAVTHPVIGLCILLAFVQIFAFSAMESCFTLFAHAAWGFQPADIGRLFGLVGILGIVVQGGLIGPLVRRFGEGRLVPIGLATLAVGLAAVPFTAPGWTIAGDFALIAIGQGLTTPSLQGLISRSAGAHQQGEILGAAQSMGALARAAGPAVGGLLLSRVAPGAPFLVSAAILCGAVALSVPATRRAIAARA
ncbi:MAG: hypothetical protein RLZZ299_310 [Pseudomonadota bacterium]